MVDTEQTIDLPDGVTAAYQNQELTLKGSKGEVLRQLPTNIGVTVEQNKIILKAARNTKRERQIIGTFTAHIKNMILGVTEGHHYKLKICSGHFPMTVTVKGQDFVVKNFVGEKTARSMILPEGVEVKVNANEIDVKGCDIEVAGKVASAIEQLTRRTKFDRRIFQDSIVLIEK